MVFEFKLPDVGEGIHEGEIVNWLVEAGEHVDEDQDIVEVMTDKATVQISSPVAGTIQDLVYDEGEVVEVGAVFCLIAPDDEGDAPAASEQTQEAQPSQSGGAEAEAGDTADATDEGQAVEVTTARGGNGAGEVVRRTPEGVLAPPSVRIEARKRGIDITRIEGSGPAGRISMEDLEAHEPAPEAGRPGTGPARARGTPAQRFDFDLPSVSRDDAREVVPIRAGARSPRASAHRATTLQAHFTHAVTVRSDGLVDALDRSQAAAEEAEVELAPVVAVVKAIAQALAEHPRLNALVDEREDELVLFDAVNVAVAWPTEEGHELRVVADAARKGLIEIARTVAEGGDDATPTVTIATLDDEDAFVSTPVLVHPQVTGLVVGSLDEAAVLDEGQAAAGYEMNLSFSFDHRWIDGYDGALLAEDVRKLLEKPGSMLLD